MGCYNFSGVLEIIKGSIKILSNNGKIMALIATIGLLLNSFTFLLYLFLFKPLHSSMNAKSQELILENLTESESNNLLHSIQIDTSILIGGSFAYFIVYSLVARFINMSTVYLSITSLCGHHISLKDLTLRGLRSFKTIFRSSSRIPNRLLSWIIVISTVSLVAAVLVFSSILSIIISLFIAIMIPTIIYIFYTSVVRVLASVILMIEENCNGSEALIKAEELIKGRRVDGLVLNLVYNLLVVILFLVYIIVAKKWPSKELVTGLFSICVVYLVIMFVFISYTFLYFKTKESHGEEIKFDGKLVYSQIPAAPLNEDIP